jgi:hypothetical protein
LKYIVNFWKGAGMSTLVTDIEIANVINALVSADSLAVNLEDGRTISVPIGWFPRLLHATEKERNNWKLIGRGKGLHWPDLDEDVSVKGLLSGHGSGESQESLKKWLDVRNTAIK